ncbi:hypothetical protein V500_00162 [Pseudogymnoascus sp. VKM F-4518 (FW-2643)]|nr:hypothetical protein V500_00162 [Pseudogymnoascus sp. VKM F-4518 (FW-2643)]
MNYQDNDSLEDARRRPGTVAPGYQPFNLTQPVFNRPIPTQTVYTQLTWALPTTAASQNDPYLTSRSPAFNPPSNYQGGNGQTGQPSLPNNSFLPSRSPDFNLLSNYPRWNGQTNHPILDDDYGREYDKTPFITIPNEKHWCQPFCNYLLEHEYVADYRTSDSSDIRAHSERVTRASGSPKHQNASTSTTVNMPQPTQAQFSNQEDRIILAITALKEGNIKSIRAAAMSYNVPFESLRTRLNGVTSQRDSTPNSRKLTSYEESALVQYILNLDLRGFPPWPQAV